MENDSEVSAAHACTHGDDYVGMVCVYVRSQIFCSSKNVCDRKLESLLDRKSGVVLIFLLSDGKPELCIELENHYHLMSSKQNFY